MPHPDRLAPSPESLGIDPAKLEKLYARARRDVDEGVLPSCQLAVARNGQIAALRTFGEAGDESLYVVFSCSKAITSAAAWQLLEEGKLALEERVADTLPEFATNGKDAVRVEQLFTHTSGFPHAPSALRDWTPREALRARFARWRLNWEPGSRFEYHPSSSMWVIAVLCEERTGMPFGELVRSRIAEPLGLADLHMGAPGSEHARIADIVYTGTALTPEDFRARGWPVPPETEVTEQAVLRFNTPEFREVGVPGGGGVTGAADLALFYQALLAGGKAADGHQVWSPETVADARRVRTGDFVDPMFGKRASRGLGITIAGDADRVFRGFGRTNSDEAFGHNGAGGQIAWADPATGLSFVYLTNGFDRDVIRQGRRGVALSSLAADLLA
jgi:CubicO group peptidase (beta-lactamase class C family)